LTEEHTSSSDEESIGPGLDHSHTVKVKDPNASFRSQQ